MFNYGGGFAKRNKDVMLILSMGIVSCIYLLFCSIDLTAAFALLFASVVLYIFCKNIDLSFMLYIIMMPFSCVPLLYKLPLGMSGLKLQIALLAVFTISFILFKKPYKVSPMLNVFFAIIILLYAVAWIRSADYALKVFSDNLAGELPIFRYLLNYVSWTVTALIPLFIIAYFFREKKDIDMIVRVLCISIVLLIGYLVFIYLFMSGSKSDFEMIRSDLAAFSGLHGNDIANYCLLSFPIVLAWALYKKGFLAFFTLAAIAVGTALCFSRTAYFLVPFGFFLFLFLSRKLKWIPVAAAIIVMAAYLLLPDMVVDRAVTGINSGNYDELSAGRIEYIWEPVLNELKAKPGMLLFGSGRYGFTNTDVWKQGRVSIVSHAHNMYLDCILDVGVIGLVIFLAFFAVLMVYFSKNSSRLGKVSPYHSGLLNGCIVSIICYMLSGFTGRTFFPTITNVYLWVVIGLGIAISESAGGISSQSAA